MANPLENDYENANTHTHDGVHLVVLAHFTKEMKLELMWINSAKEQRQGFITPPAPYTEKIGSHRVDRMLVTW